MSELADEDTDGKREHQQFEVFPSKDILECCLYRLVNGIYNAHRLSYVEYTSGDLRDSS